MDRALLLAAVLLLGADRATKVPGVVWEPGDKPSGMMPEHWTQPFLKAGTVDFVPIAAWKQVFVKGPAGAVGCVEKPIEALKKALAASALPRRDQELLVPGCDDPSHPFTVQARRVKLHGGQVLLYVTQGFVEPVLASNWGLEARFEGLTDDGKTWVGGVVPVHAKGLRDEGPEIRDQKELLRQSRADVELLAKLKPSDFTPSLDAIAAEVARLELPHD